MLIYRFFYCLSIAKAFIYKGFRFENYYKIIRQLYLMYKYKKNRPKITPFLTLKYPLFCPKKSPSYTHSPSHYLTQFPIRSSRVVRCVPCSLLPLTTCREIGSWLAVVSGWNLLSLRQKDKNPIQSLFGIGLVHLSLPKLVTDERGGFRGVSPWTSRRMGTANGVTVAVSAYACPISKA